MFTNSHTVSRMYSQKCEFVYEMKITICVLFLQPSQSLHKLKKHLSVHLGTVKMLSYFWLSIYEFNTTSDINDRNMEGSSDNR